MRQRKKISAITRGLVGLSLCLLSMGLDAPAKASDVILIANKNVAENSLNQRDVKEIFLGKKSMWTDGTKIHFVVLDKGVIRDSFLRQYVGKTAIQYKNFWRKQIFTGKGSAPKSFSSEAELVDYVAGTKGAIGYVSTEKKSDTVRLIATQ